MDTEDMGNKATKTAGGPAELLELDREFAELMEDFDLEESADSDDLADLDAMIKGTEFEDTATESAPSLSLLDIADQAGTGTIAESQAEFATAIGGFVRRRVSRLLRKLLRLVRKSKKYAGCIPAVAKAVAAFKAGKWGTALRLALAAYRCIRAK